MGVMHIPGHENQKPREVSLDEIRSVLGDCRLCELCQTRTNIVFGVGNPRARVMFVGEAPGKNEDLQGEPFVGRAGRESPTESSRSLVCAVRISILPTCSSAGLRETVTQGGRSLGVFSFFARAD